jgi:hypothetical protein
VRKWQLRFLKKAYVEVKLWNHVMGWLLEKKKEEMDEGELLMKCEKEKKITREKGRSGGWIQ